MYVCMCVGMYVCMSVRLYRSFSSFIYSVSLVEHQILLHFCEQLESFFLPVLLCLVVLLLSSSLPSSSSCSRDVAPRPFNRGKACQSAWSRPRQASLGSETGLIDVCAAVNRVETATMMPV